MSVDAIVATHPCQACGAQLEPQFFPPRPRGGRDAQCLGCRLEQVARWYTAPEAAAGAGAGESFEAWLRRQWFLAKKSRRWRLHALRLFGAAATRAHLDALIAAARAAQSVDVKSPRAAGGAR